MKNAGIAIVGTLAIVGVAACKSNRAGDVTANTTGVTDDCRDILADPANAMLNVTKRFPGQPVKVAETIERCIAPNGDDCERMAKIVATIPSMVGTGSATPSNVVAVCQGMPVEMRRCMFASYILAHQDECAGMREQIQNAAIDSIEIKPGTTSQASTDTACTISVSVEDAGVWIGTRGGTCFAARSTTHSLDFEWVEAELKQLRSTWDNCNVDVLINGSSGTYQELIHVMDVAVKVGFLDVALAEKQDLGLVFGPSSTGATKHCKGPPTHVATRKTGPVHVPDRPTQGRAPATPDEVRALESQTPLPAANPDRTTLQKAPVIIVTKSEVTYRGQLVERVDRVPRDNSQRFTALFTLLDASAKQIKQDLATGTYSKDLVKACDDAKQNVRPLPGTICPDGLAILQADETTDVRVIHTIVRTAKAAGFDNLLFAVKNR